MKRTLFYLSILFTVVACTDDMPVVSNDIETFSKQLEGSWELERADIVPVHTSKSVDITPSKDYACNKLSTAFQAKDVVSKFCITLTDNVIKVHKFYTCVLAPEQLSWRLSLDRSEDSNVNWETGDVFTINEVNEGEVQATYQMLFFNLDNDSPDGTKATSTTLNRLWLKVEFDNKESSASFVLKLKKVK